MNDAPLQHQPGPYRAAEPPSGGRLWIPGRVFERDDGTLHLGATAGLTLDPYPNISDWKSEIRVVRRADLAKLSEDQRNDYLPERRVDRERWPAVARWLSLLPLLPLSPAEDETRRARDLGLRVIDVQFHRVSDGLGISATGGGREDVALGGVIHSFWHAEDDRDEVDWSGAIDRLLRLLTEGDADEVSVVAAAEAAGVAGSLLERFRASPADLQASELSWQRIFARAEAQSSTADAILGALQAARDDETTIVVPIRGGEARRVVRAPQTLKFGLAQTALGDTYTVASRQIDRLVVPGETLWALPPSDRWLPELPPEIVEARRAAYRARSRGLGRGRFLLIAVLVGLLGLGILFALRGRGARSRVSSTQADQRALRDGAG